MAFLLLLILAILTAPFIFSLFLYGLALIFPEAFLHFRKRLKRHRYFDYARRYGYQAANRDIEVGPWVLDPWEQHLLEDAPEPTPEQYLAYAWLFHLKMALGLAPCPLPGLHSRWQCFRTAVAGFLLDFGIVKGKVIRSQPLRHPASG